MLQLSGLDTAFLNMETSSTFGHVSQLMLFKGSGFRNGKPFEAIRDHIATRIVDLPALCRRLVRVPLGLDRPYWIDEGNADLEFHVRHIGVPPPGESVQLADLVARIIERPLDRNHPLWELYVIEGLASGEVAVLLKMHHATIDGASNMEMYKTLFDERPNDIAPTPPPTRAPEDEPEAWELIARTYVSYLRHPTRAMRLQFEALGAMGKYLAGGKSFVPESMPNLWRGWAQDDGQESAPIPTLTAPRTPFNGSISPHRRVAFTYVPLATLKAIKQAAGTTLNDVVMAICGGALRNYLIRKNALPERPLIAMVPVSIRTGEETETYSNQVSALLAELATDEADPIARLQRVKTAMANSKEIHNAIPASLLQDFSKFAAPAVAEQAARTIARLRLTDRVDPICNVVISNVPGPRESLYMAGDELNALVPVSTVGDGMALNMTVVSYRDRMDFGYVACRQRVPDLWDLMSDTKDAIDELATVFGVEVDPQ